MILLCFTANLFCQKQTENSEVRVLLNFSNSLLTNQYKSVSIDSIRSLKIQKILSNLGITDLTAVFKNRYISRNFIADNKSSSNWRMIKSVNTDLAKRVVKELQETNELDAVYIEYPCPIQTKYEFNSNFQWYLQTTNNGIDVQRAWTINKGRSDVIIAVCDGGVDYTHPNLDPGDRSRIITGYDTGNEDNDPMDDLPDSPDSYANHGTHIAGIIGANPTSTHNISGVMQNCKIMPVKMVGSGGIKIPFSSVYLWDFSTTAFPSDVADAIDYAVNNGANVINLSFGFSFPNVPLIDVLSGLNVLVQSVERAYQNNVVIVASMGNEALEGNPRNFPAYFSQVIAVGNTTANKVKASTSNTASYISVCAPGTNILSTVRNNSTDWKSGTSMAAPVVSGLAGLIISQGKDRGFNLTNDDIRQILERTADDVGDVGFDNETGYGIVNAFNALSLLDLPNSLVHGNSYGGGSVKLQMIDKWIVSSSIWGLAAGTYLNVDQYEVTKRINFDKPFINPPIVWLRERESVSLSFEIRIIYVLLFKFLT